MPPRRAKVKNSVPSRGSGLDDFYFVLKKFRALSVAALTTAASVPFVAFLAGLVPPWPNGIVLATALVELVVLIMIFQLLRNSGTALVNKVMIATAGLLAFFSAAYLLAFALLTYPIPAAKIRAVKGFICRLDIPPVTQAECPLVSIERLKDAEYTAELIWVGWTVDISRFGLALLWLASFLLLSCLIASFLVYQTRVKARAHL